MDDWVQIIHPDLGPDQVAEVHRSSLSQHYAAGWRLLAEDDIPEPEPEPEPEPMSKAQAAKAAKQAEQAAQAENKEK
jgi:hypothetical protein